MPEDYEEEIVGHITHPQWQEEENWFVLRGPLGGVFQANDGSWFYFRNIPAVQQGLAEGGFDHMGGKLAASKEDAIRRLRQEVRDEYYQSPRRATEQTSIPPDVGHLTPLQAQQILLNSSPTASGRRRKFERIIED